MESLNLENDNSVCYKSSSLLPHQSRIALEIFQSIISFTEANARFDDDIYIVEDMSELESVVLAEICANILKINNIYLIGSREHKSIRSIFNALPLDSILAQNNAIPESLILIAVIFNLFNVLDHWAYYGPWFGATGLSVIQTSCKMGNISVLNYLFSEIPSLLHSNLTDLLKAATQFGKIDILDWAREKFSSPNISLHIPPFVLDVAVNAPADFDIATVQWWVERSSVDISYLNYTPQHIWEVCKCKPLLLAYWNRSKLPLPHFYTAGEWSECGGTDKWTNIIDMDVAMSVTGMTHSSGLNLNYEVEEEGNQFGISLAHTKHLLIQLNQENVKLFLTYSMRRGCMEQLNWFTHEKIFNELQNTDILNTIFDISSDLLLTPVSSASATIVKKFSAQSTLCRDKILVSVAPEALKWLLLDVIIPIGVSPDLFIGNSSRSRAFHNALVASFLVGKSSWVSESLNRILNPIPKLITHSPRLNSISIEEEQKKKNLFELHTITPTSTSKGVNIFKKHNFNEVSQNSDCLLIEPSIDISYSQDFSTPSYLNNNSLSQNDFLTQETYNNDANSPFLIINNEVDVIQDSQQNLTTTNETQSHSVFKNLSSKSRRSKKGRNILFSASVVDCLPNKFENEHDGDNVEEQPVNAQNASSVEDVPPPTLFASNLKINDVAPKKVLSKKYKSNLMHIQQQKFGKGNSISLNFSHQQEQFHSAIAHIFDAWFVAISHASPVAVSSQLSLDSLLVWCLKSKKYSKYANMYLLKCSELLDRFIEFQEKQIILNSEELGRKDYNNPSSISHVSSPSLASSVCIDEDSDENLKNTSKNDSSSFMPLISPPSLIQTLLSIFLRTSHLAVLRQLHDFFGSNINSLLFWSILETSLGSIPSAAALTKLQDLGRQHVEFAEQIFSLTLRRLTWEELRTKGRVALTALFDSVGEHLLPSCTDLLKDVTVTCFTTGENRVALSPMEIQGWELVKKEIILCMESFCLSGQFSRVLQLWRRGYVDAFKIRFERGSENTYLLRMFYLPNILSNPPAVTECPFLSESWMSKFITWMSSIELPCCCLFQDDSENKMTKCGPISWWTEILVYLSRYCMIRPLMHTLYELDFLNQEVDLETASEWIQSAAWPSSSDNLIVGALSLQIKAESCIQLLISNEAKNHRIQFAKLLFLYNPLISSLWDSLIHKNIRRAFDEYLKKKFNSQQLPLVSPEAWTTACADGSLDALYALSALEKVPSYPSNIMLRAAESLKVPILEWWSRRFLVSGDDLKAFSLRVSEALGQLLAEPKSSNEIPWDVILWMTEKSAALTVSISQNCSQQLEFLNRFQTEEEEEEYINPAVELSSCVSSPQKPLLCANVRVLHMVIDGGVKLDFRPKMILNLVASQQWDALKYLMSVTHLLHNCVLCFSPAAVSLMISNPYGCQMIEQWGEFSRVLLGKGRSVRMDLWYSKHFKKHSASFPTQAETNTLASPSTQKKINYTSLKPVSSPQQMASPLKLSGYSTRPGSFHSSGLILKVISKNSQRMENTFQPFCTMDNDCSDRGYNNTLPSSVTVRTRRLSMDATEMSLHSRNQSVIPTALNHVENQSHSSHIFPLNNQSRHDHPPAAAWKLGTPSTVLMTTPRMMKRKKISQDFWMTDEDVRSEAALSEAPTLFAHPQYFVEDVHSDDELDSITSSFSRKRSRMENDDAFLHDTEKKKNSNEGKEELHKYNDDDDDDDDDTSGDEREEQIHLKDSVKCSFSELANTPFVPERARQLQEGGRKVSFCSKSGVYTINRAFERHPILIDAEYGDTPATFNSGRIYRLYGKGIHVNNDQKHYELKDYALLTNRRLTKDQRKEKQEMAQETKKKIGRPRIHLVQPEKTKKKMGRRPVKDAPWEWIWDTNGEV